MVADLYEQGFRTLPKCLCIRADHGCITAQDLTAPACGKPDDVAGVVAMLCSDAGAYVSGTTIDVNGGWYFGP